MWGAWNSEASGGALKENRPMPPPLSGAVFTALLAAAALGAIAVAQLDARLPPLATRSTHPPHAFLGELAYNHLLNLTAIGPRVAGSYENEVAAIAWAVRMLRAVEATASVHHRLEVDVHTASGAFPVTFLDGMTNAYRGVQSVVARLSARGGRTGPPALLLNCHLDTVPDSPGASDDGAGCAVLVEVARAMAASPRLLRHDVLFLFNGAEENIMQASHAFITQHRWARDVRAFVNLEACGSGGRELLFQAGPYHPWIVEAYADHAPHPYASSLAQEIFESGLIPADTDFRIFRDFGNLSGVDLAWNVNGYVYHTRLDEASRVPPASLQHAGDNVLALATAIVQSGRLARDATDAAWEREAREPQPVFFDVLGGMVVRARQTAATAAAVLALSAAALALHLDARAAARALYVRPAQYWALVCRGAARFAVACTCGLLVSGMLATILTGVRATLAWYSRPLLLVPLYALPALGGAAAALTGLWTRERHAPLLRGWWTWRAAYGGTLLWWAVLLAVCGALRLRSGFVPLLWTAGAAGGSLVAHALGARDGRAVAAALAGCALPSLQTAYLALGSLYTLVPLTGRAGAALPAELAVCALTATLTLASLSWLPVLALVARGARSAVGCAMIAGALSTLLALSPLGFPYSVEQPQRVMVFETRRTLHYPPPPAVPAQFSAYWLPDLDAHSFYSLRTHVEAAAHGTPMSAADCEHMLYCGAPYYLPVLSFISRGQWWPAPAQPTVRVHTTMRRDAQRLHFNITGPSHVVVMVAPPEGASLIACSLTGGEPTEGPRWGTRRTYFMFLHTARGADPWLFHADLSHEVSGAVDVSVAGHALFGPHKLSAAGRELLSSLPPWTAPTGWAVDLHLYRL